MLVVLTLLCGLLIILAYVKLSQKNVNTSGIQIINPFRVLWAICINMSVAKGLTKIINSKEDYVINMLWKKIYILNSKAYIKQVLSKDAESSLTNVNKIFFSSHYHNYGVGNLEVSNDLWNIVHNELKASINLDKLVDLMEKHKGILLYENGFEYNVEEIISEYVYTIWAKYSFGDNVNIAEFKTMRNSLINVLGKTFYKNKTNEIPIIGNYICKFKRFSNKQELQQVDKMLEKLYNENSNGFLHKFHDNISKYDLSDDIKLKIVIDNAFLSILAYDFLLLWLMESIIKFGLNNINDKKERSEQKYKFLSNAFLYPNRFRKVNKAIGQFDKGDYVIMNLVNSELFFSYGPRSCIGQGFSYKFYDKICDILDNYEIKLLDKYDGTNILYDDNINVPKIVSNHVIQLKMKQNSLAKILPSYEHKGLNKFFRMEAITENVALKQYIKYFMLNFCKKTKIDGICTMESRGFLFASTIADELMLPLYTIRKKGQIAGPVISESYTKYGKMHDEIELSKDSDILGKNLIIIDDGIASGQTAIAAHNLLSKKGATIISLLVVVKHTYAKNTYIFDTCNVFVL
jgi:adenine phosphoribosyltransferase